MRSWVGTQPTDADLNLRYDALGDVDEVIEEVLREQLALLREEPASVSLPSGLSRSNGENIKSLQAAIDELQKEGASGDVATVAVSRIARRHPR